MKPFSIAGIQMRVSASYSNVEAMKMKLNILMNIYPWVDMVVYSELCAYGPLTHHALTRIEDFEEQMQELAQRHKVWLLPGSVFHKVDGLIYNTASVIDPQGNVVKRYRKMFPFYPYEVGVTPGHEFCLFDVPEVGRFGVSICYDMWFPETTRTLAVHGAEVILHPTLTGTIDREIELSIVRASAAINQCFIFDINGLDTGGSGRSIICGPDGRVTYQAQNNEEMIPIEINIDRVRRSRELGLLRLGQPLKSFRDHLGDFDIYRKEVPKPYLDSLGPLIKPQRVKELGDLQILEESVVPGRNVFSSSIPTDNTDPGAIS
ncbi:MAG: carbon-nitrogen hydrolase family protein [Flavobacteriales bacterium]|jgi:predicted amidohydrolase|nr:carbon-nitrogen hydrolase family protein [Flavobacteriales bacterium]